MHGRINTLKNHRIRVKFIINSIYKRIKYNKTLNNVNIIFKNVLEKRLL